MYLWIRLLDQEAEGRWKWMKPPPASKNPVSVLDPEERKMMKKAMKAAHSNTLREKILKGSPVLLSASSAFLTNYQFLFSIPCNAIH